MFGDLGLGVRLELGLRHGKARNVPRGGDVRSLCRGVGTASALQPVQLARCSARGRVSQTQSASATGLIIKPCYEGNPVQYASIVRVVRRRRAAWATRDTGALLDNRGSFIINA